MRKLIASAAAAAMAMSAPVTSVQAETPGSPGAPGAFWAQDALVFCQENASDVPLGYCMGYLVSSDTGYLTQFCRYLDDTGQLDQLGITFNECVVYFRQNN